MTTTDVCRTDYPPAGYGDSLAEIEATIHRVIQRIFVDEDHFLRSFVNGRTMKPYRLADLPGHDFGRGAFTENSSMPRKLKPLWLNYEDADMATGDYLCALLEKHRVTGDRRVRAEARRTYRAIRLLCRNAFTTNASPHYRRGWLPKPYGGIRHVAECFECSVDQYMKITCALEKYRDELANARERREIKEIILAFADWWIDHDFTTNYFGNCCWWLKAGHAHSTAYFLYLTTLAMAFVRRAKYAKAFDRCWKYRDALIDGKGDQANSCNQAVECAARLCELKPHWTPFWRRAIRRQIEYSLAAVRADGSIEIPGLRTRFREGPCVAASLAAAHRLIPEGGFGAHVFPLLRKYNRRAHFYHVARGQRWVHPLLRRPEYLQSFSAQDHAAWLKAYWMMR